MATITGTGFSKSPIAATAEKEAAQQALKAINGETPDIIFVFCSSNYDHSELLKAINNTANTDNIIGCTTAGEFHENEEGQNSVSVMFIKSDTSIFKITKSENVKGNQQNIVQQDFKDFKTEIFDYTKQGFPRTTLIMLTDGLAGDGEEFVEALYRQAGVFCQIVGGAAGDDLKFEKTYVFHKLEVLNNTAVFIKAFSKHKYGIGVKHGMKPATTEMKVTKAEGSTVMELDHKPAFNAYKEYGETRGLNLTPENASNFMINNNLAIKSLGYDKVRAPLSATAEGYINCATEIPQNSIVTIVTSDEQSLLNAAKDAATEALENTSDKPAGILVFDCICRKTMLKDDFIKEINTIRETIGEVPLAGFDTYGEIARFGGKFNGFHNSTAVILVIPE